MLRRIAKIATCLVSSLVLLVTWATQVLALDVTIEEFALDNGMQVVVIPDRRAPVVTHSVWYRVGSADEAAGKSGLAHFLEHLMFKGTAKFPFGEFDKILERNGAQGNAFTTRDYTAYYQRIASDRLAIVMELEADRMQNLVLNDENVLPELSVVREERRQRTDNDPVSLLAEQVEAAMFSAHPYGRPVIGWMSDVAKLTRQDAMDFYRANYTPANAVLIVAGDVTPSQVKSLAEKYYGPLVNTFIPKPRSRTPEPEPIVERRLTMSDERARFSYVARYYLTPSRTTANGREALALDFLSEIVGNGSQSRIYKELVLGRKLAAEAGSWFVGSQLDNGQLAVFGVPNPGVDLSKLEQGLNEVIDEIKKDGVTQHELDRVRNQMLAQQVYALDNQMTLLTHAGTALMSGMTAKAAFSTEEWEFVTPDDIKSVAQKYLVAKNSVTGALLKANTN
jgi:zinc protease